MKTLEDWKDAYYEQQARFTESNGMLTQERDTYKADALRYRWLRHRVSAHEVGRSGMVFFHYPTLGGERELLKGSVAQHFDAAIDAKIAEAERGTEGGLIGK